VIDLNFHLSSPSGHDAEEVLADADETALRYDLFQGDIIFRAHGVDFSARWGWVPVLDFAVALQTIVDDLEASEDKIKLFEFTDSDATIRFERLDDTVKIETDYAPGSALVPYAELRKATENFFQQVVDQLITTYPSLAENSAMVRYLSG
jgi:hypothetical protein